MKVKAAVIFETGGDFQIEELELDEPRDDEVLVRVVASGICHTDLGARAGHLSIPEPPSVFGHEGAGIVEKVGARVTSTAPARGLPKTKRPTRWGGASGVLGELFHQPPSGGQDR